MSTSSSLAWWWWWESRQDWTEWLAGAEPAALPWWWAWTWAVPRAATDRQFASARGLSSGVYHYQSTAARGGAQAMGARPVGSTPQSVALRTHDKYLSFSLSFAPDVASGDAISAATVTVQARPRPGLMTAGSDVTSALLVGQSISGASITVVLGNANATVGTHYLVRVVATMASGVVLQETIGDGHSSAIVCDE